MNESINKINRLTISILIYTITLFGLLSFFINKDLVDSWINYYVIFASGISILILFFNNIEEFKWKNIKKIPFFLTIITIAWIVLCAFLGIRLNIESLKGIANFGCLLMLGFIITNIKLTNSDKKSILNSIYFSFFICICVGIYQYFSGVNLIQYSNDLYPGILGRINSTFYIATILDKYIVIICILLMYSMLNNPKKSMYKFLYLLGGIGISLTFSRSGQLAFVFVSGVFFLISLFKKQASNVLAIIITIGAILLIPGMSLSLQSGLNFVYEKINIPNNLRIDISFINEKSLRIFSNNKSKTDNDKLIENKDNEDDNDSIKPLTPPINQSVAFREKYMNIGRQIIKEYSIFGIGPGNYSYLYNNQNFKDYLKDTTVLENIATYMYPHNGYIQTAAEIGYIGLALLFIILLSYMFYIDYKKEKLLGFTCFMLLVVLLLAAYTEGVFHSKQYIFLFFIIFGLLCSKNKKVSNEEKIIKLLDKTYSSSKKNFAKQLDQFLKNEEKAFIVTANPEAFMIAETNDNYYRMLLDDNTKIVPDGIGLVKAGRLLGYNIAERIPGIEIAESLLQYANKYKKSIYLFGSKPEVIERMKDLLENKYSNANLIGAKDGYIEDKEKVFKDIIKKEPDIVLVALGMPAQEELIYKHLEKCKKGIFVGVGGSFDVLSGTKKRAPRFFQKLNIEWLYRILKEPSRIIRFFKNNISFIIKVKKIKNN